VIGGNPLKIVSIVMEQYREVNLTMGIGGDISSGSLYW